jgi:hypothetical protein
MIVYMSVKCPLPYYYRPKNLLFLIIICLLTIKLKHALIIIFLLTIKLKHV